MCEYLSTALVVVGWVSTHVLSLRAQKENLRLQVFDRARNEITQELRAAQRWYVKIESFIAGLSVGIDIESSTPARFDWTPHYHGAIALLQSAPHEWISRLEEYEIVFPETAVVRERLVGRQRGIVRRVSALIANLRDAVVGRNSAPERKAAFAETERWLTDVRDQAVLLEDMIIHLQNQALSKIMGRRIPPRIPRDVNLPRVVMRSDRLLWIEPDRPDLPVS